MKVLIAASAMVAIVVCGNAQAQTRMQTPSTTPLTESERVTTPEFINKVWNMNSFEIRAGQEAKDKAKDAAFKEYAQSIVSDHTRMNDELKSAVQKMRATELPTKLDSEHQQKLQQLTSASGAAFEGLFKTQQIQGHEQALRLFQSYAANGDNADLKSWAQTSIAGLQRHFEHAHNLPKPEGEM
jgi:putative membrane protein